MLNFIKAQPQVVSKLLLHMSTSPIMDLLLKIISMEETQEGKGTVQVGLPCIPPILSSGANMRHAEPN